LGRREGVSSHSTFFVEVNFEIEGKWIPKHQRCYCCMSVSLNLKTTEIRPICAKCRLPADDQYYLKTQQLPVWYSPDDSVQLEVPSSSLTMAEKLHSENSPFLLGNIYQGVMGLVCFVLEW
jgi:hypothetical protein